MTNGDHERRIGNLEVDVDTLKETGIRLDERQQNIRLNTQKIESAIYDNGGMRDQLGDVRTDQAHMIRKLDDIKNVKEHGTSNGTAVTFKWIVEKLVVPVIIPILSAGGALYLVVRLIQQGAVTP